MKRFSPRKANRRNVTARATNTVQASEKQAAYRKAYVQRPEVKEKMKAYRAKRAAAKRAATVAAVIQQADDQAGRPEAGRDGRGETPQRLGRLKPRVKRQDCSGDRPRLWDDSRLSWPSAETPHIPRNEATGSSATSRLPHRRRSRGVHRAVEADARRLACGMAEAREGPALLQAVRHLRRSRPSAPHPRSRCSQAVQALRPTDIETNFADVGLA